MKRTCQTFSYLLFLIVWSAGLLLGQALPKATPEEVGLSSERLERLNAVMQKHVAQKQIAGGVALVMRHGKIAYLKSFGFADIESGKPVEHDTIFRIASMTKPITSVAVMMLYEKGRLLLNDPVSKYIPEFKNAKVLQPDSGSDSTTNATVPSKKEITIHQLLTHTSGLTYHWNKRLGGSYKKAGITHGLLQDESTLAEKMKILAGIPLLHQPGEAWEYGLSIDVLGRVVEVVSGKSLDEFFRERVFKPLGMNDTYFYLPAEKVSRLASVYSPENGGLNKLSDVPVVDGNMVYTIDYPYKGSKTYFSGGGGLSSTITDYARFAQMMLNGGELGGARLLGRKTVDFMTTDHVGELNNSTGFGLGFSVVRERDRSREISSVGTYGWGGFFYTTFFIDPKEDLIGICMSQLHPNSDVGLGSKARVLVYQAIVD